MAEFLLFMVADRQFGIPVLMAEHVVRMVAITRLPAVSDAVAGIINYHGTIIPVFSLRNRFMLPVRQANLTDVLIITATNRRLVALIADEIIGVRDIDKDLIQADAVLPGLTTMQGIVKTSDGMILIPDPERFLFPDEDTQLSTALELVSRGVS